MLLSQKLGDLQIVLLKMERELFVEVLLVAEVGIDNRRWTVCIAIPCPVRLTLKWNPA